MVPMRETPKVFNPLPAIPPIDHPRGREYAIYAQRIRYPKPFWNWLEETERREAGKSLEGWDLQRMMNEDRFCGDPLKIRIHAATHGKRRK